MSLRFLAAHALRCGAAPAPCAAFRSGLSPNNSSTTTALLLPCASLKCGCRPRPSFRPLMSTTAFLCHRRPFSAVVRRPTDPPQPLHVAAMSTQFCCCSNSTQLVVCRRGHVQQQHWEANSISRRGSGHERFLAHSASLPSSSSSTSSEAVEEEDGGEEVESSTGYLAATTSMGRGKARIVVLGTGWAASRLMKDIDTKLCDIVCVSPRNHMVFTPLLASTCVGTLEFRSVAEPVVRIQSALSTSPDSYFFLGRCVALDPHKHEIRCVAEDGSDSPPAHVHADIDRPSHLPKSFRIAYDKLVIAAGAQALTFNIRGVQEHAIFLREVSDAQNIRKKLLLNLMLSDVPGTSEEEKRRLLHCVVVGGGPTGVEFSGELSDFIRTDVHQQYAHVKDYIHVTLIEAKEILSSFDVRLRLYAMNHLEKAGVKLVKGVVKDVQADKLILSDGSEVPYGLLVWSTGVGPSAFVKSLDLPKSRDGRIGVDEKLRVPGLEDVYAIGDCAGYVESVGRPVLPALAQVAERQGKYLARELNRVLKGGGGHAGASASVGEAPPFEYRHLGSMASVGRYKALVDLRGSQESKGFSWAGFLSWLIWRSAYLTRVVSWRNRFYVAVNWATTFVFGRDISRI